jgi:hypothetical protein
VLTAKCVFNLKKRAVHKLKKQLTQFVVRDEARRRMTFQKMKVVCYVINVNCVVIKPAAVVMTAMRY